MRKSFLAIMAIATVLLSVAAIWNSVYDGGDTHEGNLLPNAMAYVGEQQVETVETVAIEESESTVVEESTSMEPVNLPFATHDMYVLGDHVIRRMEPNVNAIPIDFYLAGEKVTVIGEEDDWYRIEDEGYIRKDLLTDNFGDIIPHFRESYPDLIVTTITTQHTEYWKNGELITSGECVTGDAYLHPTPIGLFCITSRQKDVDAYPGDDWFCEFYLGIGYHNAGWPNQQFGGTVYKGNGSHGCIRCPDDVAKAIFDNCQVDRTYVLILP